MADGSFGAFVDDATLRYERTFPHPIERVWKAITEPAEVREWFMPWSVDLRVGGVWHVGEDDGWRGAVAAPEPPRLVRLQHGPDMIGGVAGYLQYELEPVAAGTRMVFTHHFPGVPDGLARENDGVAGGWHEIFDRLTEWLAGAPIGSGLASDEFAGVVERWAGRMVAAGEFDAAAAQRYVLDLRRDAASEVLNRRYRELERQQGARRHA